MSEPVFDPERLKHYPLQEVTADFARRYSVQLTVGGRPRFFKELETVEPRLRTLAMLETLRDGLGRDGLHTFLFLNSGDIAPELVDALLDAKLHREAEILSQAIAAFGPVYPVESSVREKLFGYHTSPNLNALDLRLMLITNQFGDSESFAATIESYVRHTPDVLALMEAHRAKVEERTRLHWLQLELTRYVDVYGAVDKMQEQLAKLPPDYRLVLVLGVYGVEFFNGSVHQFFYNQAGVLAPEVVEAFETLKLPRQAAVMRKAIAMFDEPYERDTEKRRARYFSRGFGDWDKELDRKTYEIEGVEGEPFFVQAVEDFASERGILPR